MSAPFRQDEGDRHQSRVQFPLGDPSIVSYSGKMRGVLSHTSDQIENERSANSPLRNPSHLQGRDPRHAQASVLSPCNSRLSTYPKRNGPDIIDNFHRMNLDGAVQGPNLGAIKVSNDSNSQPTSHGQSRHGNQAQRKQQARMPFHQESEDSKRVSHPANPVPLQEKTPAPMLQKQVPQPSTLPYVQRAMEWRPATRLTHPQLLHHAPKVLTHENRNGASNTLFHALNATIRAQIDYLDHLAYQEVQKVQIPVEEYEEKENLRRRLEEICRAVILDVECSKDPEFEASDVSLRTFGSLSIGFATRDSDMDLVLISPRSVPELASPVSEIPRRLENAFMKSGYGVRLLTQTRVPIIKFCEKPSARLAGYLRRTRLIWEDECELKVDRPAAEDADIGPQEITADDVSTKAWSTPQAVSAIVNSHKEQMSTEFIEVAAASIVPRENEISASAGGKNLVYENVSSIGSGKADWPAQNEKSTSQAPVGAKKETFLKTQKPPAPPKVDALSLPQARCNSFSNYTNIEALGLCHRLAKLNAVDAGQRRTIISATETLEKRTVPHQVADVNNARSSLQNLEYLLTQIPALSREELEYPKDGVGVQCDINFSNELALQNSALLKCYSLCDPRVRIMVLFVKAWTKRRHINSPYHGTLNSYGYVLMVVHFLVNIARPPVLPNLQLRHDWIQCDPLSTRLTSFQKYNIQFFRNEHLIEDLARQGKITQNRESIGSLLRGFFIYYASPPAHGFRWKEDVLSLRTPGGLLSKQSKGWVSARSEIVETGKPGSGTTKKVNHHYIVAIEDPFEIEHNVARTVFHHGVVAIRDEFRRAVSIIVCAGLDPVRGPQDLFAEGKKNENLQLRRRGPSPVNKVSTRADKKQEGTSKAGTSVPAHKVDGMTDNSQKQAQSRLFGASQQEPRG